jgi:hypothetical protein
MIEKFFKIFLTFKDLSTTDFSNSNLNSNLKSDLNLNLNLNLKTTNLELNNNEESKKQENFKEKKEKEEKVVKHLNFELIEKTLQTDDKLLNDEHYTEFWY